MIIELGKYTCEVLYLYRGIRNGSELGANEKESMGEWKLGRDTSKLPIRVANTQQQSYKYFQWQQDMIEN